MRTALARACVAAAVYGGTLGAMHSVRLAALDMVKFPLLVLLTGAVCAAAFAVVARALAPNLGARAVGAVVATMFGDLAVLLASLAPVNLFLCVALEPAASAAQLNDYPLFLGLNMLAVAVAGSLAVARQGRALLHRFGVRPLRASALLGAWLALSLGVGGQGAFYLRPFFGITAVDPDPPLFEGARPDFRGASNFFEVVGHLLSPPRRARPSRANRS